MAFIRWKRNKSGLLRAQLVHSHRDANGKPRQKILAHLGDSGTLTPDRIPSLQAQYPDLKIDWQALPSSRPKPSLAPIPETLSDEELWQRMGELRRHHGLNLRAMITKLQEAGLPPIGGGHMFGLRLRAMPLRWTYLKSLENSAASGQAQPPVAKELLPYLRKVLLAKPTA